MKLLKFYLRYFLFRSTKKLKNIIQIIESQGFHVFSYLLEDEKDDTTILINQWGCHEHAKHHSAFIISNSFAKGLFIKENLNDDDRLELYFHEEAHILYDHPFYDGYTNNTTVQQEKVANFFLFRLRLLKAATYTLFFAALLSAAFLLHPLKGAEVADEEPQAVLQTAVYTAPEEDPIPADLLIAEASAEPAIKPTGATVYITPSGERYHRPDCYHIEGRTTLPLTIPEAEQFNKTPCKTCQP
ncbi:MAG: hypothetical protein IJN80_05345 [Clostridia bacterium]|nr:hypothetical protein [Clostridia bacterium]